MATESAQSQSDAECEQPRRHDCPLCGSRRICYAFSQDESRVVRCPDCRLMFLNPQPSDAELAAIYAANYFLGAESDEGRAATREMKRGTAREYLSEIVRYRGQHGGRLLEIGCGDGDFLVEASAGGYEVHAVEYAAPACEQARARLPDAAIHCGELASAPFEEASFDVCVMSDVIEHVRDPLVTLAAVHKLLKPGGAIFIATPSLSSWSARMLGQRWMEWKREHLTYFSRDTIETALFRSGFEHVIVQPNWKILTLDYVARHFERFPVPFFTPLLSALRRSLPRGIAGKCHRLVASGISVFACKKEIAAQRSLSVIIPAYNEAATLGSLVDSVLRKEIPGLDIEVLIVESGSSDGTREIALGYQKHPRVKVILEEKPRGKGRAVRTGLAEAKGDFILIQDADLEYDLEDYDALLEPLIAGRAAFTLGARHGGGAWKMRQFTGQPLLSAVLNSGHLFFTTLVNVLFLQRLKDPFTMFKVFRRDCLYGLRFECNRFDFDYELLVKLLRKGYRVLELPVNYRSRSFKDGKKVTMFGDPLNWIAACLKLRVARIDPMGEVERSRAEEPPHPV